jgi:hypothetical protein
MTGTDIHVPSEHVQEGKQYDAEVQLAFVYEIDHYKNKAGKISIFMDAYEGVASWPYLDKLICQWRRAEEEKRSHCGLDPAPVYKKCELYRGQVRTEEDLYEAPINPGTPTRAPLVGPDPIPILDFGGTPPEFRKPLSLCQGDCDFDTDCKDGLICFRRYAFEAVPGCIGGEQDDQFSDYCVFDPYGMGYSDPTTAPTTPPTMTPRPTNTPLTQIPVQNFGGHPPVDLLPLQLCQGDCDSDTDCAAGLYCFQRDSNQTVPGCIGAERDIEKTDYCTFDPYGPGYTPTAPRPTNPPVLVPLTSPPALPPTLPPVLATLTSPPAFQPTSPPMLPTTMTPVASPTMAPIALIATPTSMPSYYPRPVGDPQKNAIIVDWNPDYKLGECEGDCDTDEDCMGGMYCYQRNSQYEPIPGCLGGEFDRTLTDYCTFVPLSTDGTSPPIPAPTSAPVIAPTPAPVIPPTSAPVTLPTTAPVTPPTSAPVQEPASAPVSPLRLENLGWTPRQKLGHCQGDCDTDEDCVSGQGLVCFQRNSVTEPVPGCIGGENDGSLSDYCVMASSLTDSDLPTISPGEFPTAAPFDSTESVALINYGWSPPISSRPLHRCEGDCDLDSDCQPGLVCFERYLPYQTVPGCIGGESDQSLTDYCIPASLQPSTGPGFPDSPVGQLSPSAPIASPIAPPASAPIAPPVASPIASPIAPPASTPIAPPVASPIARPTAAPSTTQVSGVPPPITCSDYEDVSYDRMCKLDEDSCCANPRSSTNFCHEQYLILGDAVASACYHCCNEATGSPIVVGPAPVVNSNIPQTVECSTLENSKRMCKDDSCCSEEGSKTSWCQEQDELHPGGLQSICVSNHRHSIVSF